MPSCSLVVGESVAGTQTEEESLMRTGDLNTRATLIKLKVHIKCELEEAGNIFYHSYMHIGMCH